MIPGIPAHPFDPDDDDQATCDWLLSLVDESPDRLAIITIPSHVDTDEDLDALEGQFLRAYDLAKIERPDLSVKPLPGVPLGNGVGLRAMAAVHEHLWVGGACAYGCPDTRPVDGEDRAA